jgi:hypothetical protein
MPRRKPWTGHNHRLRGQVHFKAKSYYSDLPSITSPHFRVRVRGDKFLLSSTADKRVEPVEGDEDASAPEATPRTEVKATLVVCPPTLCRQWQAEIEKHSSLTVRQNSAARSHCPRHRFHTRRLAARALCGRSPSTKAARTFAPASIALWKRPATTAKTAEMPA